MIFVSTNFFINMTEKLLSRGSWFSSRGETWGDLNTKLYLYCVSQISAFVENNRTEFTSATFEYFNHNDHVLSTYKMFARFQGVWYVYAFYRIFYLVRNVVVNFSLIKLCDIFFTPGSYISFTLYITYLYKRKNS